MSALKVSYSGVRGIVGRTLTREVARRFGRAFGRLLQERAPSGLVLVGRDTRPSGPSLRGGLLEGLAPFGFRLVELGVVPTPTVQFAMEPMEADGAVVITASHNPAEWNGFKFLLGPERTVLDAAQTRRLVELVDSEEEVSPPCAVPPAEDRREEALRLHLERVLAQVDPGPVRRRAFKVALDAGRGAGLEPALRLLDALGCRTVVVEEPRDSEPLPENLAALCRTVREQVCDLGLAQDLDGDRLALVSEQGTPVGEELTLVLSASWLLTHLRGPEVVVVRNVSTTRAVDDLAAAAGARIVETRVGEVNLSRALAREIAAGRAAFGGEGSGGLILPRVALGRDSLSATAVVLEALAGQDRPLSEVAASLPSYPRGRVRLPLGGPPLEDRYHALEGAFPQGVPDTLDGLRLRFADAWLLVRPSNTEPVVRAVVEATTPERVRALLDRAAEVWGR